MAQHRLRVCVDYNDDGTPVVKQVSASSELALADRIVRAVLGSNRRDEFLSELKEDAPPFKEYTEEYFKTYKLPRIKPTTAAFYRQMLDGHFYDAWKDTPLNQITTKDVQDFLNDRKHLSAKYLKEMRIFLKSIFESARKDCIIASNPADDKRLIIPSNKKTERKALEIEEVKDIAGALCQLDERDRRFMALLLYTGMRRGEVLGLRWEDIDLEQNVIHVMRNVTYPYGKNEPNIGTPKTQSGERDIPIIPELIEHLKPLGTSGYVIGGDAPITLSVLRRLLERIKRTIETHSATPHVFRHSFATLLNDAGADMKTIQDIIGDADFQTTANRYVHSRVKNKHEALTSAGKILAAV